jgi:small subunit ribosomal protein S17
MVSKKKKDETEEAVEATTETEAVEETAVEASADEAEASVEAAGEETESAVEEAPAEVEAAPADETSAETVEAAPAEDETPAETVEAAPAEEAPKKAAAAKKPARKEAKAAAPAATETVKKGGKRAEKVGVVKSDKMTKTVVVRVDRLVKHPIYRKYVKKKKNFMAHDELGARTGDKVRIVETRPLSARKRWRVIEIIQKAER